MGHFYKILTICLFLTFLPSKLYSNIVDELTKLNNLFKEGAITKEEFQKAKDLLFKSEENSAEINSNKINNLEKKNITKEKNLENEFKNKNNKIAEKENSQNIDLTNTYASLQDVEDFGSFYRINYSPKGMFEEKKFKSFASKAKRSLSDMYLIFVEQKYLMEKYPENVMKAMGYFEFFYMDQLRQKKRILRNLTKHIQTYQNISKKI